MKLGLAAWSLNRRFGAATLKLLDYPQQVKEEFGLAVIEFISLFFDSTEKAYLLELRRRTDAAGARVANLAVSVKGDLASASDEERRGAVADCARWFDVALAVGSPYVRAFAGGPQEGVCTEDILRASIRSFQELAARARKKGVKIIIENHGGVISREADHLVRLMKSDRSGFLGMCPDFGNFAAELRYEGLEKVAPWARVLHAKTREFDAKGEDTRVDVKRCLDIFRRAGFDGDVLVEFEGEMDDHAGVLKSIELLRRCL